MPADEQGVEPIDSEEGHKPPRGSTLEFPPWVTDHLKAGAAIIVAALITLAFFSFLGWYSNSRGIESRLSDVNNTLGEASVILTSNQTELATLRDKLTQVEAQLASAVDRLAEADELLSTRLGLAQDRLDELRLLLLHVAVGDPQAAGFVDIENSPHKNDIRVMAALGIVGPCDPSRAGGAERGGSGSDREAFFCPDDPVKLGAVARALVRLLRLDSTDTDFYTSDDGSRWESSMNALAEAGIFLPCPEGGSCPDQPISREETASVLVDAFRLERYLSSKDTFVDDQFSDYHEDINRLAAAAVTRGCNPPAFDRFCPDQSLTRGEWASFLQRSWLRSALPLDS